MKNLAPLGSVVLLKDGTRSLMVIGANRICSENKFYDYIGVLHPEGYVNADGFFLFNHEDIQEIKFIGCVNSETQVFRQMMEEAEQKKEDKDGGE